MAASEINLKPSEVFKITLGEDSYEMRKPRARELSEFKVRLSKVENDDNKTLDELISFLVSLGLPKEFCDSLDMDQLTLILNGLSKKK